MIYFIIFFLISGVHSQDDILNHIYGTEFVDIVNTSDNYLSFQTENTEIYLIAQKTVNHSVVNYNSTLESTKRYIYYTLFFDHPTPLVQFFPYAIPYPEVKENDEYLFYFFDGSGCNVIFYTNKDNDEIEFNMPINQKACFVHVHKNSKLPVVYQSNVTRKLHKDLNLTHLRVVFESRIKREIDYPEIRGYSRFLNGDITNFDGFKKISQYIYIAIIVLTLIYYGFTFYPLEPRDDCFETTKISLDNEILIKY